MSYLHLPIKHHGDFPCICIYIYMHNMCIYSMYNMCIYYMYNMYMYMCMRMCMYVYIYIYIMYMCIYIYIMYMYMCICMCMYMYMSSGRKYLLLTMDMAKVGGPLSVVKVCTSMLCVRIGYQ